MQEKWKSEIEAGSNQKGSAKALLPCRNPSAI